MQLRSIFSTQLVFTVIPSFSVSIAFEHYALWVSLVFISCRKFGLGETRPPCIHVRPVILPIALPTADEHVTTGHLLSKGVAQ